MSRFCFVHAADLHLDTPFEGLRSLAPAVHAAMRDASLAAWDDLVVLALDRGAAFVLLAGDLYDGAERGVRAQLRVRAGLETLSRAGIPVLAVHGNHDPTDEGWSAIHTWPSGVEFFPSDEVKSVAVERDGAKLATVHGISYAHREMRENLALRFRRGPEPGLQIGLLHCNVDGASGHADYSPCSLRDLERANLDYWALGHIHRHQVLRRGDPWVVYPGCLQGRSPRASELGPKGAVVVEVEDATIRSVEAVALDRVRFVLLEQDVATFRDLGELEAALWSGGEELRDEHRGRSLVLQTRLLGRSPLYAELRRAGTLQELVDSLRDRSRGAEPFLWWEPLRCEVDRPVTRGELRERDDFASAVIELSDAMLAEPADLADFVCRSLEDLDRRSRGIDLSTFAESSLEERAELLREGEERALDALREGGE